MSDLREQGTLLAMTEMAKVPWHEIASLVEDAGSAEAVIEGRAFLLDEPQKHLARMLAEQVTEERIDHWSGVIRQTLDRLADTYLVTALDDGYPENLRKIFNHPPFLFVRGRLLDDDSHSVAVVGTRQASPEGRKRAHDLAEQLAARGVTVVSGLAAGIDSAAHTGAIDGGGRTIAVMGTGIDRVYPRENAELAEQVAAHGALVSQFWPGSPPRNSNFPLRNVVTSGIGVGTVVIEASSTSGAKMQARLALEHGKRVLLMDDLVMQEDWAQKYAQRRGAVVVSSVDDILEVLDKERAVPTALHLF